MRLRFNTCPGVTAVLAFFAAMLLSFGDSRALQGGGAGDMAQRGEKKRFGRVRWKERRGDQRRLDLARRGDLDRRDTGGPAAGPDIVEQRLGERRQRQGRRDGERRQGDGGSIVFGGISLLYWTFALIALAAVVLWLFLWYDHVTGGGLLMGSPTLQDPLDSIKLK